MDKLFLKPGKGKRIKDPLTLTVLKDEGEWKPGNTYWHRRVKCGDCIESAEEYTPKFCATEADLNRKTPKKGSVQ